MKCNIVKIGMQEINKHIFSSSEFCILIFWILFFCILLFSIHQ